MKYTRSNLNASKYRLSDVCDSVFGRTLVKMCSLNCLLENGQFNYNSTFPGLWLLGISVVCWPERLILFLVDMSEKEFDKINTD